LLAQFPEKLGSLATASRFQIAISSLGLDARLFIVDILQWTNADLYPSFMAARQPYGKICKEIDKRFAAKYGSIK
jgi:hypothetical protein